MIIGLTGFVPHNKVDLSSETLAQLGKEGDRTLAERAGVSRGAIRARRMRGGIPPVALKDQHRVRGKAHPQSKINQAVADGIREEHIPQHPEHGAAAIARRLGLHPSTIHAILKNRTWRKDQ